MGRQQGRKPIKRRVTKTRKAVTPKAGPKKRRTKKEMEEARKAEAIAKNHKPVRNVKRAGRVRTYNYVSKRDEKKQVKPHASIKLALKKPRKPEEIPAIVRWLERNEERFENAYEAMKHFQEKVCQHEREHETSRLGLPNGKVRVGYACDNCGRVRYA